MGNCGSFPLCVSAGRFHIGFETFGGRENHDEIMPSKGSGSNQHTRYCSPKNSGQVIFLIAECAYSDGSMEGVNWAQAGVEPNTAGAGGI